MTPSTASDFNSSGHLAPFLRGNSQRIPILIRGSRRSFRASFIANLLRQHGAEKQ